MPFVRFNVFLHRKLIHTNQREEPLNPSQQVSKNLHLAEIHYIYFIILTTCTLICWPSQWISTWVKRKKVTRSELVNEMKSWLILQRRQCVWREWGALEEPASFLPLRWALPQHLLSSIIRPWAHWRAASYSSHPWTPALEGYWGNVVM